MLRKILILALTIVLFVLALEGGLRIYLSVRKNWVASDRSFSHELGWKTDPNSKSQTQSRIFGAVNYSTTRDGFRRFGDPNTTKTKILVIGDSGTQATMISDGETYYDYIAQNYSDIEIFAYGCAGYGSLQEFMILDKYFDEIQPDLIIWQYDENDFYNNYAPLEFESLINNNRMKRPYWVNGRVEVKFPGQTGGFLYNLLNGSHLIRLVGLELDFLKAKNLQTIDDRLTEDDALFKEAYKVTSQIMAMVNLRVDNAPVVAFGIMDHDWVEEPLKRLTESNGMHYIPGVNAEVMQKKQWGIKVDFTPHDTHWNAQGHEFLGRIILNYLIKHDLVKHKGSGTLANLSNSTYVELLRFAKVPDPTSV